MAMAMETRRVAGRNGARDGQGQGGGGQNDQLWERL